MSKWFISALERRVVSETIEIDKPLDDKARMHFDRLFNILQNIEKDDSHYEVTKKETDDKYIITITQDHEETSREGTMPHLKQLLNRYKINYREIENV